MLIRLGTPFLFPRQSPSTSPTIPFLLKSQCHQNCSSRCLRGTNGIQRQNNNRIDEIHTGLLSAASSYCGGSSFQLNLITKIVLVVHPFFSNRQKRRVLHYTPFTRIQISWNSSMSFRSRSIINKDLRLARLIGLWATVKRSMYKL